MSTDSSHYYFEKIVSNRSALLDLEDGLLGNKTLSLETQDMAESDILTYVEDHFTDFIRVLRYLDAEDQELLLSYYVLAKSQHCLAPLHSSTQTLTSSRIRQAMQTMCSYIICGPLTLETFKDIFSAANIENNATKVSLSDLVHAYSRCKSFEQVAQFYSVHRPQIRRLISAAAKTLSDSDDRKSRALGSYLSSLMDKACAVGVGTTSRKTAKRADCIVMQTPRLLGQFRRSVTDKDFSQVFMSRANR